MLIGVAQHVGTSHALIKSKQRAHGNGYSGAGCLLLFYKNYIVYQIVYMLVSSDLYVSITSPSFVALNLPVSGYVACMVVFMEELHCLLQCLL